MPPVHELYTVYGIQHHLGPALISPLLPPLQRRVLEHQTDTVVAHVCANVDCELVERHRPVRIRTVKKYLVHQQDICRILEVIIIIIS